MRHGLYMIRSAESFDVVYFGQIRPLKGVEDFISLCNFARVNSSSSLNLTFVGGIPAAHRVYAESIDDQDLGNGSSPVIESDGRQKVQMYRVTRACCLLTQLAFLLRSGIRLIYFAAPPSLMFV